MLQTIFDFADYIAYRTRNFLGRELVLNVIDRWLADPDGGRQVLPSLCANMSDTYHKCS
jgi:hypothetical protein